MEKSLVSICIPICNGSKYIEESLLSAISQTYQNKEIIISDDNSSDLSLETAKRVLSNTSVPYKILKHKPSGIGANWNNCIKNASGKYIKLLFQDDVLESNCITELVNFSESHENLGMVFCKRELIGDKAKGDRLEHAQNKFTNILSKRFLQKDKQFYRYPRNKFGEPPVTLIPLKTFLEVGYFNESLKQMLDFEYWLRVNDRYSVGFINKVLVKFRIHSNQTTAKNRVKRNADVIKMPWIIIRKYFLHLQPKVKLLLIYKLLESPILYFKKMA